MKKSIIALATATLIAGALTSSANAATVYDKDGTSLAVYGRVQSVLYSAKQSGVTFESSDKTEDKASITTSGRLGVDMRTQLFGDVAAFGAMEWDVADGHDNQSFGARTLWVGLDFGQYGSIKAGRFEPAMKYAISQTDIFEDYGALGFTGGDDMRKGTVMYEWSGMGFDFLASYVFANNNEIVGGSYKFAQTQDGDIEANEEGNDMDYTVSFAAGYTSPDVLFGPINIRLGYEKGEFAKSNPNQFSLDGLNGSTAPSPLLGLAQRWDSTITAITGSSIQYDSYQQFAVGLSWGSMEMGPYVGAVYQQRTFDVISSAEITRNNGGAAASGSFGIDELEVSGYEFVAAYTFANGISARTGYLSRTYDAGIVGEFEAKVIPVLVAWQVNPQFDVWAEARFDAGTDDDKTEVTDKKITFAYDDLFDSNFSENVFSAGIRYQF